MQPIAEASGLFREFKGGGTSFTALRDVSCKVMPGDRIAIVGPSGSGKSTLLHILAGLDRPTAGSIVWPALVPTGASEPQGIAVVFQNASLLPSLTVLENVALPLLLEGREAEAEVAAREALGLLALGDLEDQLPEQLSGGQAQQVAIARALSTRPRLLLADEPTGQLDGVTAMAVVDRLLGITGEQAALVVATHDPAVARRMTILWQMRDGKLAMSRTSHSDAREIVSP